jgi:hypothetical protein
MTNSILPTGRSNDWKLGYQAGVRHAKESIWSRVYDYVYSHDPRKADELKIEIMKALTEKSARERQAEMETGADGQPEDRK